MPVLAQTGPGGPGSLLQNSLSEQPEVSPGSGRGHGSHCSRRKRPSVTCLTPPRPRGCCSRVTGHPAQALGEVCPVCQPSSASRGPFHWATLPPCARGFRVGLPLDHRCSRRAVTWAASASKECGPQGQGQAWSPARLGATVQGDQWTGPGLRATGRASCSHGGTQMDRLPGSGQHPACRQWVRALVTPSAGGTVDGLGAALRWLHPGIPPGHAWWPVEPSSHTFFQSRRPCGARPSRTAPCARRPCRPPSCPPRPETGTWKVCEGLGPVR